MRVLMVLTLLAVMACGAIGGKPSASAPGGGESRADFWEQCQERRDAIDRWEEEESNKVADKWIDGEITMMRGAVEVEEVKADADALRDELMDNCEAKAIEMFGREPPPTVRPSQSAPFPTLTKPPGR